MNKAKVKHYITVIETCILHLKEALDESVVEEPTFAEISEEIESPDEEVDEFTEDEIEEIQEVTEDVVEEKSEVPLKSTALNMYFATNIVNNPNWPEAVPQDLLCDHTSEEDLICRAGSIIDQSIDVPLEGKNFLDFGCGDGYIAREVAKREVASSTGYDMFLFDEWEDLEKGITNLTYTDDYDDIKDNRYDVILAYDVIDHCDKPIDALVKMKRILAPEGVVYVRCHPWTSRHGTHLYKTANKAYIHLAVQSDTLKKMGHQSLKTKKLLRPVHTYREWFDRAGYKIKEENVMTEPLESFFRENEKVQRSLHKHWLGLVNKGELNEHAIDRIMEIQFIDYTLVQKEE